MSAARRSVLAKNSTLIFVVIVPSDTVAVELVRSPPSSYRMMEPMLAKARNARESHRAAALCLRNRPFPSATQRRPTPARRCGCSPGRGRPAAATGSVSPSASPRVPRARPLEPRARPAQATSATATVVSSPGKRCMAYLLCQQPDARRVPDNPPAAPSSGSQAGRRRQRGVGERRAVVGDVERQRRAHEVSAGRRRASCRRRDVSVKHGSSPAKVTGGLPHWLWLPRC